MTLIDRLKLFEGFGIEAEYMIVDRHSLRVKPICDQVLAAMAGGPARVVQAGKVAWSNELVLHVIELKANGPHRNLHELYGEFRGAIGAMNERLKSYDAMLLPTAMHPFFEPQIETRLWESEDSNIYATYDRIFGCKGHGWSNLQSLHINLPFGDDEEFGRLHAAIRLLLPLLPAIAASSPIVEGQLGAYEDSRLSFYLQNQRRIPSIIGPVVPERVFTKADYEQVILQPMYRDIAPLDTDEILQEEWLNSRAAIARFERHAIEIRLVDIGESSRADFSVIAAAVTMLRSLVAEEWTTFAEQKLHSEDFLRQTLLGTLQEGLNFKISDQAYLAAFGLKVGATVGDVWRQVLGSKAPHNVDLLPFLVDFEFILDKGPVAKRVLGRLRGNLETPAILEVYRELAECLREDRFFE